MGTVSQPLRTPRVHARILQVGFDVLLIVTVQFAHKLEQLLVLQPVLQVLPNRQRKQIRPVDDECDMAPAELAEDAREHQLQSALAVGHAGERLVAGLILEHTLHEGVSKTGKRVTIMNI